MVTIATWNVENLFTPAADSGPSSVSAYRDKLQALAATMTTADADVWALQEVGEQQALDDLIAELDGDWHGVLSGAPDGRGIANAYVSKLFLHDPTDVVDLPLPLSGGRIDDDGGVLTRLGRGALQVRVQVAATSVTLICCHLKSKLLTYPGGRFNPRDEHERARYGVYALNRRAAEAGAVRIHTNTVLADNGQADTEGDGDEQAVIVLGDLNDTPQAATTQLLLGPGGSEIGTAGQNQPDQGDPWRLWNLAPLIPEETRYSRIYRGTGELIDHILVSKKLLDVVGDVRSLVHAADGSAHLPSITDEPNRRTDAAGSDHAPQVATFEL